MTAFVCLVTLSVNILKYERRQMIT